MTTRARRAWAVGRRGRGLRFTIGGLALLLGAGHPQAAVIIGTPLFVAGICLQLRNREEQG